MITKINEQEFKTNVVNEAAAVVDFSATWCGPCRMMAPVLEDLSEKMSGKADFYNLDVDEAPEVAAQFSVSSIPCLVLLKNGQAVSQSVGFKPGDQIKAWIEGNL